MKKIVLYIIAGITSFLLVAFFIWAVVIDKKWLIYVSLFSVVALFLGYSLIITKLDDKKNQKEQQRPSDYTDKRMGKFKYDKFGKLSKQIKWCDDDITLSIDGGSEEEIKEHMIYAFNHFENPMQSNKILCEYLAEELLDLANEWNSEGISREDFIQRISLVQIEIKSNGDYEFLVDADGIFTDHSIVVYGNVVKGFYDTDIIG